MLELLKNYGGYFAAAAAAITAAILAGKYKPFAGIIEGQLWDQVSEERLNGLHPVVKFNARRFINAAYKEGIKLRITSGYRSLEEQEELYNRGRTTPGPIVTYARPGYSWHNYGRAIDVVEMAGGVPLWNNPRWERIGRLGETFGFEWGGRWSGFKDRPHFQMTLGNSLEELRSQTA